jgi:hypothetical protein
MEVVTIFVTERDGSESGQMLSSQEGYLATLSGYGVECLLLQNGIKIIAEGSGELQVRSRHCIFTAAARG